MGLIAQIAIRASAFLLEVKARRVLVALAFVIAGAGTAGPLFFMAVALARATSSGRRAKRTVSVSTFVFPVMLGSRGGSGPRSGSQLAFYFVTLLAATAILASTGNEEMAGPLGATLRSTTPKA